MVIRILTDQLLEILGTHRNKVYCFKCAVIDFFGSGNVLSCEIDRKLHRCAATMSMRYIWSYVIFLNCCDWST